MADDVTLGTRIRQLRKANGWTLADVAARTGLSVSFLSDIERGRTDPSLNTLDKIAAAHGLRVAITITKDGDTPMADDVTLLPCPFCGAPAEVYVPYGVIRCSNPDCLMEVRTMVNLREERRAEVWNARVPDPRIADLEAQLAEARELNSTLADTADALRAELQEAQEALAVSGIGGIYDDFQGVADAIEQMALYIKERDRHVTELEEEIVRLRLLANANVRVAAQTHGRPITRAEALAISHATLETAEAERIASDSGDDALVALAEENARLKAELSALRERQCETCKHSRRISDIAYECKRTRGYFVMRAHDWCSWWEQSKKKRGATNE